MCGILAVIGKADKDKIQQLSKRQKHRGPDEWGIHQMDNGITLAHERLSIIDLNTGTHPIQGTDTAWVIHNGEIYNHNDLRKGELSHRQFRTTCDSEVIVHLYEEYGYDFCNKLDGVFAFVVVDGDKIIAGRDPIGVKPMYYGYDSEGIMYISSEMKAIADQCEKMEAFPPGHYFTPETGFVKYFTPEWEDHKVCNKEYSPQKLNEALTKATKKRLMSDVPLGVLLSGGLDSSLTSSITKRLLRGTGQKLHSFSVGVHAEASDLKAAKKVADFLGTEHHQILFSIEEGLEALEKVIWHLETYDVTTIRAATPMYFLSKAITDMGIKVVLSGEGADEIFGGYLYFHNAPSDEEFQKETISRVFRLSTADCLRADKATMATGLEARVPFLDKGFLDVAMRINPADKRPDKAAGKIEKYVLRKAFDDKEDPYLPEEILWRQKEQFGDGVGYSWIDTVKEHCEKIISDEEFSQAEALYPHNTPDTKEAFYFRKVFAKYYPEDHSLKTVLKWIPKWQKNTDPSGRAAEHHFDTTEKTS
ncbi:MAG: asparagine synthase B [Bacteroidales bacterium]|nr:asparagine synthase B [Bacteroidales bacterium]